MGLSSRKIAVGRALARRLQTYRLLDAPALMLSTYKALQGGEATEQLSMEVLMASEPVEDVQQLSAAVMREAQQYKRSVIVTWDGAVERSDFMVMQQGIVAHLDFDVSDDEVLLPAELEAADRKALLNMLEVCPLVMRHQVTGVIADLCRNERILPYVKAWRSDRTMLSATQLLMRVWEDEEMRLGYSRENGVIGNLPQPLQIGRASCRERV